MLKELRNVDEAGHDDDCAAEWDFIKSDFSFGTILVVFLMHYYKIWIVFE